MTAVAHELRVARASVRPWVTQADVHAGLGMHHSPTASSRRRLQTSAVCRE